MDGRGGAAGGEDEGEEQPGARIQGEEQQPPPIGFVRERETREGS